MMNLLFAFLASAAITPAFRVPLPAIPWVGLVGMLGWAAYWVSELAGAPMMMSAFLGALAVGAAAEALARRLKHPATLFVIPGLFPLVPGLMAYGGMLFLAREELTAAAQMLARTLFYAGALAAGLALPPALMRRYYKG